MKVQNVRPYAVDVPMPLGGVATVEAGGELSTSDEHAASLLEQPINWAPVAAKAKKEAAE